MPLNPTKASTRTEVPIRGMIAMAKNGVPAYGPQESDSNNAVEATASNKQGAGFWYGHAGPSSGWHVHVSSDNSVVLCCVVRRMQGHCFFQV